MTLSGVADAMLDAKLSLHESQDEITRHMLEAALRRTGGNKSKAARLLQLHRNTFDRNLEAHKVEWKEFRWPTSRRKSLAAPAAG
jgi:DNA-binding NtrC family response regulator